MPTLSWLPVEPDWKARLNQATGETAWAGLVRLANSRLDFVQTMQLDRRLTALGPDVPAGCDLPPVRLAVLASSTIDQLLPALRIAALRRGLWLTIYTPDFGQYAQELHDPNSGLHAFKPGVVLFSFDAAHLVGDQLLAGRIEAAEAVEAAAARIRGLWRTARTQFGCQVIQQTILPTLPPLMGGAEYRLAGSPHQLVRDLNHALRRSAGEDRTDIFALDDRAAVDGLDAWHDPALWHRAKQEVSPRAAPMYGDLVLRIVAARGGRSAKCLVLDLDNTLWGGVIGDDGLEGIVIGQGSALGEAHLAVQTHARNLARRGVILAVCSKNDESTAIEPFENHPEMLLKRDDIACFVANWEDKASNIRHIAKALNIGLDALVFVDDNPAERDIVRRELPMVMTPELPDDPALYARCLADAGYFEALEVTEEDLARTRLYQARQSQEKLKDEATDMDGFLAGLSMTMGWRAFDALGMQRVVQLINKTNQFNLTTRRYTEEQVAPLIGDPRVVTLQIRLADKFGDHGVIAVLIGRLSDAGDLDIDTWLMSCRVLGRGVEEACANLLVEQASGLGARAIIGRYDPTAKNGMVADLYARLGFDKVGETGSGQTTWRLPLDAYSPKSTHIRTLES